jgi:hypothetical protein
MPNKLNQAQPWASSHATLTCCPPSAATLVFHRRQPQLPHPRLRPTRPP